MSTFKMLVPATEPVGSIVNCYGYQGVVQADHTVHVSVPEDVADVERTCGRMIEVKASVVEEIVASVAEEIVASVAEEIVASAGAAPVTAPKKGGGLRKAAAAQG